MSEATHKRRILIMSLVGFMLSVVLLALLFYYLPFTLEDFWFVLKQARWAGLVGIVFSTAVHCQFSAYKWRLVTRITDPEADLGQRVFGFYSTLIALLGQVLPLQVAVLVGRSLALKMHAQVPVKRSASGAIYDQFFDVLVPLVMLLPILLVIPGWGSAQSALTISLFFLVLMWGFINLFGQFAVVAMLWVMNYILPEKMRAKLDLSGLIQGAKGAFDREVLIQLYGWSMLRYLNLIFRAWLIAWTMHIEIDASLILFANCAVMFTVLLNFVPGALGVAEWGWVGTLALLGVSSELGMAYAVSNRLLTVASLLVVTVLYSLLMACFRGKSSSDVSKES